MESQKTITDAVNDVLKVTQEDDGGDEPKVAHHHSESSSSEAYPAFAASSWHPVYDGYHPAYDPGFYPQPAAVHSYHPVAYDHPAYDYPVEHHTVHHHHHEEKEPEEKAEPAEKEVVLKKEKAPSVVVEKDTPSKVTVRDPTPEVPSPSPNSSVMRAIASANEQTSADKVRDEREVADKLERLEH